MSSTWPQSTVDTETQGARGIEIGLRMTGGQLSGNTISDCGTRGEVVGGGELVIV